MISADSEILGESTYQVPESWSGSEQMDPSSRAGTGKRKQVGAWIQDSLVVYERHAYRQAVSRL